MKTRKQMGSATAAIFVLLAGVALPVMAAAQDVPSMAASASDDSYRYIDDADALLDAMGTSPPDHGFRFDGIDCWAWAMADGSTILAEPLGDDYRYYVFAPGDGYPFFVGDQTYAYGFDGRTLAAVYGDNGDLVDPSDDIIDGAQWLSDRGFGMKRAMQTPEPVYAGDWADSIGWFGAIELRLDTWRTRPGWIRYRAGRGRLHHRDWHEKLGAEGQKRRQRAEWFDRWRRDGYRGPPPGGGKWVTAPGADRPDKDAGPGNRPGRGHWIGRPRPVAPPTPGTPGAKPGWPARGDNAGPGRRPYPPRFGRPVPGLPTPTSPAAPVTSPPPVVVAPTPGTPGATPREPHRGDNAGPGRRPYPPRFGRPVPATPMPTAPTAPVTSPSAPPGAVAPTPGGDRGRPMRWPRMQSDGNRPTVGAPPAAPASAPTPTVSPAPGAMRGGDRFERPVRVAPQPPMVKTDRGGATDSLAPRPEPRRLPPPVTVAPRPSFTPPRAPVSAPPPPPPSPPSPPAAVRVVPPPPAARPGGMASAPRTGGSPRGDGGNRGGGKGRDK